MRHTFDFSADYLIERKKSITAFLDPTGERALSEAKMLNRELSLRKTQHQDEIAQLAYDHFQLPDQTPEWWGKRLRARGMWVDLVHLKAKLIRPKKGRLRRRRDKKKSRAQG